MGKPRKVAIAVRTWAAEESVFVWNWAKKYFIQTGRDRDWLYIVHVNTSKGRGDWKASGPTIPDLDRALQGYSYDIVELSGDSAHGTLVQWVESEPVDVLILSTGKSRRLPNPIQSRTTDYIAANAACATLVIHPKMSLADITRCHNEAEGRDPEATGIGSQRRVAYADESQDGINSLMHWASERISRPDDIELQVLINRNSMLARVSEIIRPARRRHPASTDLASAPVPTPSGYQHMPPASSGLPLSGPASDAGGAESADAVTASSHSASGGATSGTPFAAGPTPGPTGTIPPADEAGVPAVLKGKPSQVIKRFVNENNIDMLVIQGTAPQLKRTGKREIKPSRTFVYHKSQCTCLCVPVTLLRQDNGPATMMSGLLLSEEDEMDEDLDARSSRLPPAPPSPTGVDLHMRHMEPHIKTDNHLSTSPPTAHSMAAPSSMLVARGDGPSQPLPSQSLLPSTATTSSSGPLDVRPSAPMISSIAAGRRRSFGPSSSQPSQSPAAPAGPSSVAAAAAAAVATAHAGLPGESPKAAGSAASGEEGGAGSGSSSGLFSSLRSRGLKLPFRKDNRDENREETRDTSAQVPPVPPLLANPELVSLDSALADLHSVLQEGGLSGERRERGAADIARARVTLAALALEASSLRARLEEQEERRAAAVAVLLGGVGANGMAGSVRNAGRVSMSAGAGSCPALTGANATAGLAGASSDVQEEVGQDGGGDGDGDTTELQRPSATEMTEATEAESIPLVEAVSP